MAILYVEQKILTRFTEDALAVVADIWAVRAVHWCTQAVPSRAGCISPKTIVI
jgi:hypothetical protein